MSMPAAAVTVNASVDTRCLLQRMQSTAARKRKFGSRDSIFSGFLRRRAPTLPK